MILLLERQEILQLNPTFTAYISYVQQSMFDPFYGNNAMEPGKMYDPELGKVRYYSKNECDLSNNQRLAYYNKRKDQFDPSLNLKPYMGRTQYNFLYAPIEEYIQNFAASLTRLTDE